MTDDIKVLVKRLRENCSCADNVDAEQQPGGGWVGNFARCDNCRSAAALEAMEANRDLWRDKCVLMEAERDRLAGEVERLTVAAKAADLFHAINGHGIKQAEELADHIIRQMLWGMRIDDSNNGTVRGYLLDHFKAVIARAEKAEAEVARLKAALKFYARKSNWKPTHDDPEVPGALQDPEAWQDGGRVARKALGETT